MQKQLADQGGEVMTVELDVDGNEIIQTMTYKTTHPADAVAIMKQSFEEQASSLESSISGQIASIEKETGISGISWTFDYCNGDGASIFSMTIGGK